MKTPRWPLIAALAVALTLSACGTNPRDFEPVTVGTKCVLAMTNLADARADGVAAENAALTLTTQACGTAAEFVQAIKDNPETWNYKSAADVDATHVITTACRDNADEVMCRDAKATGLLD